MHTRLAAATLLLAGVTSGLANAQAPGEGPTETDQGQGVEAAPADATTRARGELYGFAMADMGYNAGTINEDWFDTMRPTQLPNSEAQKEGKGDGGDKFPTEGNTFASVRQSRLGVKGWFPTDVGEIFTIFEIEMFGVGVDAGQTTIRLRHAYGEFWAAFRAEIAALPPRLPRLWNL